LVNFLSVKGQMVNIWFCGSCLVSTTSSYLFYNPLKCKYHSCLVNHIKISCGQIWSTGHNLLTSVLYRQFYLGFTSTFTLCVLRFFLYYHASTWVHLPFSILNTSFHCLLASTISHKSAVYHNVGLLYIKSCFSSFEFCLPWL